MKIASRRQNVTEINISDCRGVHDQGVSSLVANCPGLQKYTAYRCKQLGDTSVSALATHCHLLVKVHVGNQDKLTDDALKKVPQDCFTVPSQYCYNVLSISYLNFLIFILLVGGVLWWAKGYSLGSVLQYHWWRHGGLGQRMSQTAETLPAGEQTGQSMWLCCHTFSSMFLVSFCFCMALHICVPLIASTYLTRIFGLRTIANALWFNIYP